MMKKIFKLFFCLILIASSISCSQDSAKSNSGSQNSNVEHKPQKSTKIYYLNINNWEEVYCIYQNDSGNWTEQPGIKMEESNCPGFKVITIASEKLLFEFNNGKDLTITDNWDFSQGVENLRVSGYGTYTVVRGKVYQGVPTREFIDEGDLDGDGIENQFDKDIDGDSLPNSEEILFGTDPYKKDTDGDGYDDGFETKQFDSSRPDIFNPTIADLPKIELTLVSEPMVTLDYETTEGTEETFTSTQSSEFSKSHSSSTNFSRTNSFEWGLSIGIEATTDFKGGSISFSNEWHWDWGTSDTHGWEKEVATENIQGIEKAKSLATSESLTKTGGRIVYTVRFKNAGHIAFKVENMELAAYKINASNPNFMDLIAQLNIDTTYRTFQPFVLAPGEKTGPYGFQNDRLMLDDVYGLYSGTTNGSICAIAGKSITYDGKDLTKSLTNVNARTAKITIDYGVSNADKTTEEYNVATLTKFNKHYININNMYNPVTLKDIMNSLGIIYRLDDNNKLISVRNISQKEGSKFWYIVHTKKNDYGETVSYIYNCPFNIPGKETGNGNLDEIFIRTGDDVQIVCSEDKDGDGVPLRIEKMLNISDDNADSDGDSLPDGAELKGDRSSIGDSNVFVTNPALADTDQDGVNDAEDSSPITSMYAHKTTLSRLFLVAPNKADGQNAWYVINEADDTQNFDFKKVSYSPANQTVYNYSGTIDAENIELNIDAEHKVSSVVVRQVVNGKITTVKAVKSDMNNNEYVANIKLALGSNIIEVIVNSLDRENTHTYKLNFKSSLLALQNFTVHNPNNSPNVLRIFADKPADSRISKTIILRSLVAGVDPDGLNATAFPGNLFGLNENDSIVYGPYGRICQVAKIFSPDEYPAGVLIKDENLISGNKYYYTALNVSLNNNTIADKVYTQSVSTATKYQIGEIKLRVDSIKIYDVFNGTITGRDLEIYDFLTWGWKIGSSYLDRPRVITERRNTERNGCFYDHTINVGIETMYNLIDFSQENTVKLGIEIEPGIALRGGANENGAERNLRKLSIIHDIVFNPTTRQWSCPSLDNLIITPTVDGSGITKTVTYHYIDDTQDGNYKGKVDVTYTISSKYVK